MGASGDDSEVIKDFKEEIVMPPAPATDPPETEPFGAEQGH